MTGFKKFGIRQVRILCNVLRIVFQKKWYSKSGLKKMIHPYRFTPCSEMIIVTIKFDLVYTTGCCISPLSNYKFKVVDTYNYMV